MAKRLEVRIPLTIHVLPKTRRYVECLMASGLYGRSLSSAGERLLAEAIGAKSRHPLFKKRFAQISRRS